MTEREDMYTYEETDFDLDTYVMRVETKSFLERNGILILPNENYRQTGKDVFMPDTFDFLKWANRDIRSGNNIRILPVQEVKVIDLRSQDFWLPLVYIFSDASLQIY